MISNDKKQYRSAAEWLSALKQDETWLHQQEQLENSAGADAQLMEYSRKEGNDTLYKLWVLYNHDVEKAVTDFWDENNMSLAMLKIKVIDLLTLEWIEQHKPNAGGGSTGGKQQPLNLFAPKKNLQELLRGAWFAELRSNARYDAAWTDAFVEALMQSEHGEEIAREWAVKGARDKKCQLKGYIVGLLTDAGVLRGSYDAIAVRVGITEKPRTFSSYMGKGKRQPYADWVLENAQKI